MSPNIDFSKIPETPKITALLDIMQQELSKKEEAIFRLLRSGKQKPEIITTLGITDNNYRSHIYNIRQKLQQSLLLADLSLKDYLISTGVILT